MTKSEILGIIQPGLIEAKACLALMEKIDKPTLFYYVWDNDLESSTDILLSDEIEQWKADHPNCKSRKLVPAFMAHDNEIKPSDNFDAAFILPA